MKKGLKVCCKLILAIMIVLISCSKDNPTKPGNQDAEAPTIAIQVPTAEPGYVTLEDVISIGGSASDDQALSSIKWSTNNSSGTAAGLENWTIQNIPLLDGDNVIRVTAYDKANNSGFDEIVITKNEFVDFYGTPFTNPSGIFVNDPTDVLIRANLSVNPNLIENSVRLIMVDENNNLIEEICQLYDDGNLNHGDDILGDNVYSTIYTFIESHIGDLRLRIRARTQDGTNEVTDYSSVFVLNVFKELTDEEFEEVISIQENVVEQLNNNFSGHNLDEAINAAVYWLNEQAEISSASLIGGNIEIMYASGLEGGLLISEVDQYGQVYTKGGIDTTRLRGNSKKVPYNLQSVGNTDENIKIANNNEDIILDKDVLIYAPFEQVFSPDMRPSLEQIFSDSKMEFNVLSLRNQQCTINSLNNLTDYGLVIFDTHGSMGEDILTGELVTKENKKEYASLIRQNKIKIWTDVTYSKILWLFNKNADIYSVRSSYISSLFGTFPNSVIFNGSCESTRLSNLRDAFISKGAKTYYGFDKIVNTTFCRDMADDIFNSLAIDFETTGDAFTAGQTDPQSPNAEFEMFGSQDMHFTLSLINGDFEMGNLTAWSKDGDGRVITQLGSQYPTEGSFMGIISTGLGFTTSTGSLSQSFKVEEGLSTLSFKWNFLSEEFLEYVGSQYQDYFKIIIRNSSGQENIIFEKAIDDFDSEYNLILVSPQIVFDRGDVYMTGWHSFIYDLSQYENQTITLVFKAGDIGDSIYDSAILLDEIKMN